jgi:hypothetical protein
MQCTGMANTTVNSGILHPWLFFGWIMCVARPTLGLSLNARITDGHSMTAAIMRRSTSHASMVINLWIMYVSYKYVVVGQRPNISQSMTTIPRNLWNTTENEGTGTAA